MRPVLLPLLAALLALAPALAEAKTRHSSAATRATRERAAKGPRKMGSARVEAEGQALRPSTPVGQIARALGADGSARGGHYVKAQGVYEAAESPADRATALVAMAVSAGREGGKTIRAAAREAIAARVEGAGVCGMYAVAMVVAAANPRGGDANLAENKAYNIASEPETFGAANAGVALVALALRAAAHPELDKRADLTRVVNEVAEAVVKAGQGGVYAARLAQGIVAPQPGARAARFYQAREARNGEPAAMAGINAALTLIVGDRHYGL